VVAVGQGVKAGGQAVGQGVVAGAKAIEHGAKAGKDAVVQGVKTGAGAVAHGADRIGKGNAKGDYAKMIGKLGEIKHVK
jgi:hypothetical protein